MIKRFSLINRWDLNKSNHSGSERTLEFMAMRGYPTFPKALGLEPLNGLVSYIGHSFRGGPPHLCRDAVGIFYSSSRSDYFLPSCHGNEEVHIIPRCNMWQVAFIYILSERKK